MNKVLIPILFILTTITWLVFFPDVAREKPTYYTIQTEYETFPNDYQFNFENIKVNYTYFYKYGLDMKYYIARVSNGNNELIEDATLFGKVFAKATPVYDNKNIVYWGQNNNGKHVYKTHTYLHFSVYVSYPLSLFDQKKEYVMDLGESTLFTKMTPKEYKVYAPNLKIR